MCGIFAFLTKNAGILGSLDTNAGKASLDEILDQAFMEGRNRGPEASGSVTSNDVGTTADSTGELYWYTGFHRLAINGLTDAGMQPFVKDGVVLVCNGEIYNYKELYRDIGITDTSCCGSDCQVILDYYLKYGIEYTVSRIHGVFAFVIIDTRRASTGGHEEKGKMYVVRDRVGVRSLYWAHADANLMFRQYPDYGRTYAVASELKQLTCLARRDYAHGVNAIHTKSAPLLAEQFSAGHIATIDMMTGEHDIVRYWSPMEHVSYSNALGLNYKRKLVDSLFACVKRRVDACEREMCCLLSGGLDSSLIASMVSRVLRERGERVKTFSIGMPGSEDLRCARIVADFIDSEHTEVIVTNDDMFSAIPEVVKAIETYDTTSVRASVGNYLVCKFIRENCDAKVVFNGDGADEVMGGYLYFQAIPDFNQHEKERLRLLDEICHYDVLRSDKSIAGNGLEARTPYLDPEFIRTYFAAAAQHYADYGRMPTCEKELIRTAVDEYGSSDAFGYVYLPNDVLFRRKEAFSDGVSGETKSWKDEIEEKMTETGVIRTDNVVNFVNQSDGKMTMEQAWYKTLFYDALLRPYSLWFNDLERLFYERLETRWMPRFVKATDPSARTLAIYAAGNAGCDTGREQ